MDSAEFHAAVYRVVRLVPFGRATSYGHVAKLIGMPRHARHVGQALKFLPEDTDVPWQRIVSSSGKISSRGPGTTGAQMQRDALEEEGVHVHVTRDGDFAVNWDEFGWFPEHVDNANEATGPTNGSTSVGDLNQNDAATQSSQTQNGGDTKEEDEDGDGQQSPL